MAEDIHKFYKDRLAARNYFRSWQITSYHWRQESRVNHKSDITGQAELNHLASKIDQTKSDLCESCSEKETIQHYVFHCEKYNNQRNDLERGVEEILARNGIVQSVINLKVLTGNLEEASRSCRRHSEHS